MKRLLTAVVLCLPAFGQTVHSGYGNYSGAAGYGALVCGPPTYDCFVSDTAVHNFVNPVPSWGPNTCDSTSMDTLSTCGNLIGANVSRTPANYGNAMIRCTDANTVAGHPEYIWTTFDDPFPVAWAKDDSAFVAKVAGGTLYVFRWDSVNLQCSLSSPAITFTDSAIFSRTDPAKMFAYSGTILQDVTINLANGSKTATTKYDFNNSSCLTNSVNGYTGGSYPQNGWTGVMTSSLDDSTFTMAFSTTSGQGSGYHLATWTVGQSGCDLYNTLTGTVTHNGTLVGTVPDTQWGGTYGGKADRFHLHSGFTSLNPNWSFMETSPNLVDYGSYVSGYYFWQKGTANVVHCGIGAPNWTASHSYVDGNRVNPSAGNAGDYIYQIVNGVSGTSGASAPTWNQTPGSDTADGGVTWRNVGLAPRRNTIATATSGTATTGSRPGSS